jgi:Eukaryotic phosphomannomutase
LAGVWDTDRASVETAMEAFDYGFAENGLTAYRLGQQLVSQSFIRHVGEDEYKKLVRFILHYIADLDIPIKRYITIPLPPRFPSFFSSHLFFVGVRSG